MVSNHTPNDVIYLASCAINNIIPEKDRVEMMDLDSVYSFASAHMIRAMVAMALESAGYVDARSGNAIAASIRKTVLFTEEYSKIKRCFEEKGIWYMPLKGAILKDCYPKTEMREFSDYDILIDPVRAEDVNNIMKKLGFETIKYGLSNEDIYYKKPVFNFEMHNALFDSFDKEELYDCHQKMRDYYKNVEDRLLGNGCEKHFSPEDFYIYLVAHEYKHYIQRGTGLRTLTDTFVYLKTHKLDMDYVYAQTEKLGIYDFEKEKRILAMKTFGTDELTSGDSIMLDYFLSSGTYGTEEHHIRNYMRHKKMTKTQYMFGRFVVPFSSDNKYYDQFAKRYPFFYKYKIFLPVLPFYRTIRSIRSGRFRKEAKAIWETDKHI